MTNWKSIFSNYYPTVFRLISKCETFQKGYGSSLLVRQMSLDPFQTKGPNTFTVWPPQPVMWWRHVASTLWLFFLFYCVTSGPHGAFNKPWKPIENHRTISSYSFVVIIITFCNTYHKAQDLFCIIKHLFHNSKNETTAVVLWR